MVDQSLLNLDDDQLSMNQESEEAAIIAKWKDKPREELERAKAKSDLFIRTQNARFDDLRKDYLALREQHQAGTELKELIDQLRSKPKNEENNSQSPEGNTQPAIKPEDIDSLVTQRVTEQMTQHQRTLVQRENFNTVQAKLKEQFGPDYQNAYKQRLETLGLDREFADDLAKNHPTVFMKTFELDTPKQQNNVSVPRNTQRPSSFAPNAQVRNWAYYQEMKKTNPKLYLDPKIAIQMDADAQALGDEFGLPLN
jgi:hypothetical protein